MNPFNTPIAETYLELNAALIKAGANNPEKLLKIFPQLCEHSFAMARLLKQKTLH